MPLIPNAINLGEPWAGSQDTPSAPLWQILEMGGFAVRIGYVADGFLQSNEHILIRTPPRVSNTPITLRFYAGEYLNNVVRANDTRLVEIGTASYVNSVDTINLPVWRAGHNRTVQLFVTVVNPRDLRWPSEGGYAISLLQTAPLPQGRTISPAGITPTTTAASPRVKPGAVTIGADGPGSRVTFGYAQLSGGTVRISPDGPGSRAAFGQARLRAGSVSVTPTGVTPTVGFGTARLGAGRVIVGAAGFRGDALGAPALSSGGVLVAPVGVANDPPFGTARLSAGAVTIAPTGLAPTSEVAPPVASSGGTVVSVVGITSAAMVGSPAVTGLRPVPKTITALGAAAVTAVGSPAVSGRRPTAKTISPLGIAARIEIGRLRFTQGKAGPRVIKAQSIDSANTFGSVTAYGLAPYSPYVVTFSIPSRTSFGNYASIRLASQPQLPPGADPLERVIMANIASVRTAQEVLTVEIPIDLTKDTYTDPTTGAQKPIAEGTPAAGVPLVKLPRGARVIGGGVVTTSTVADTATKVGLKLFEPKTNTTLFNGDDIKSAGNRPIAGSGVFFEDTPVHLALTATKITAGQVIVSLQFAVRDRADYNLGGV